MSVNPTAPPPGGPHGDRLDPVTNEGHLFEDAEGNPVNPLDLTNTNWGISQSTVMFDANGDPIFVHRLAQG